MRTRRDSRRRDQLTARPPAGAPGAAAAEAVRGAGGEDGGISGEDRHRRRGPGGVGGCVYYSLTYNL